MRACVNKCAISNEHFLVGILVPHASVSAKSKGEKGERDRAKPCPSIEYQLSTTKTKYSVVELLVVGAAMCAVRSPLFNVYLSCYPRHATPRYDTPSPSSSYVDTNI